MNMKSQPGIDALLVHEPFLRALSGAILRGDDRVDDVLQETWRTALTKSPRDPGAMRSWLGKITGNLSRRVLVRDAARDRGEGGRRDRPVPPTPGEIAEREETRRRVLDALLSLDEPYRGALLLRFYDDLPPREVAKRLGVPVETTRTQIRRGLERLRGKLDEYWLGDRRARMLALLPLAGTAVTGLAIGVKVAVGALLVAAVAGAALVTRSGFRETPVKPAPREASTPPPATPPRPIEEPPPRHVRPAVEVPAGAIAGMVDIPAGPFRMGIDESWFKKTYLRERKLVPPQLKPPNKDTWWPILLTETPAHEVVTEAYAIDRYEVTNAQYLAFLNDRCQRAVFTTMKMNCLYDVARSIFGENPTPWELESLYWQNEKKLESMKARVLGDNDPQVRNAIREVNEELPPPAHRKSFDELPERVRLAAWATFRLPEGTALNTYTRVVPKHWPRAKPSPGELNHPVRYVNALDADAFAEWAGKHVPTEEEWEKAARGPANTIYPWGDKWVCDDPVEKNFIIWNRTDPAPRGPASALQDRPVAVDQCPEGQSGYGCFNMLGNVMEWTSSIPKKYPGSASTWDGFGARKARAVRGQSYGSGVAFFAKEISIRTTARILDSGAGPINELNLYQSLGFRCAKYIAPARDVLSHFVRRSRESGLLPDGLSLDPARGFGVERRDDDPDAEDMVFVKGETRALGLVPATKVRSDLTAGVLGLLAFTPGIEVAVTLEGGTTEWITCDEIGFLLALRDGHAVLQRLEFEGPVEVGVLAENVGIEGVPPGSRKSECRIDAAAGVVTLCPVLTGESEDVAIEIPLKVGVSGGLREGWR
jgi:RNA polymerase sigma factor (sigma-70 family)